MPEPSGVRINANGTVSLRPEAAPGRAERVRQRLRRVGQTAAGEHGCETPAGLARPRLMVIAGGQVGESAAPASRPAETGKPTIALTVVKS